MSSFAGSFVWGLFFSHAHLGMAECPRATTLNTGKAFLPEVVVGWVAVLVTSSSSLPNNGKVGGGGEGGGPSEQLHSDAMQQRATSR